MKRPLALAAVVLVVAFAAPAQAVPIINSPTGLDNPGQVITFSEIILPAQTVLTNQYSSLGVTFQGVFYNPQGPLMFPSDPSVGNYNDSEQVANPFSIFFTNPQTTVAFQIITNPGNTTIEALLNGVLVDSFVVGTSEDLPIPFQGFLNSQPFNQIRITTTGQGGLALIDNIQFPQTSPPPVIPEPATVAVFGALAAGAFGLRRRMKTATA